MYEGYKLHLEHIKSSIWAFLTRIGRNPWLVLLDTHVNPTIPHQNSYREKGSKEIC